MYIGLFATCTEVIPEQGCYQMTCVPHLGTKSFTFDDMNYRPLGVTVTNLNTQMTLDGVGITLEDYFRKEVGNVLGSEITDTPSRTATIWFKTPDAASMAISIHDGKTFQGMKMVVTEDGKCPTEEEFLAEHTEGYPCTPGPFYQAAADVPESCFNDLNVTASGDVQCCPSGGFEFYRTLKGSAVPVDNVQSCEPEECAALTKEQGRLVAAQANAILFCILSGVVFVTLNVQKYKGDQQGNETNCSLVLAIVLIMALVFAGAAVGIFLGSAQDMLPPGGGLGGSFGCFIAAWILEVALIVLLFRSDLCATSFLVLFVQRFIASVQDRAAPVKTLQSSFVFS